MRRFMLRVAGTVFITPLTAMCRSSGTDGAMSTIYVPSILLDSFALSASVYLLARTRMLRLLHPAAVYLGFHLFCVSARLIMLLFGFSPMPAMHGVVTSDEMIRAALYADISLIAMTAGWLWAAPRGYLSRSAGHPR